MVMLTINSNVVEVPKGSTVLDAARKLNIEVPTMCHHELLDPSQGANCRMCLVEVQGAR
ncbi:MAG: 2Fe-2S iron-sulfur cluster binding domain-containing protein, partial [Eubacteriaceae bacterium]|nr:2Fe-2S iron-sulfur cluster binding domain-containing protein [Eubacteriaceae bacterium]